MITADAQPSMRRQCEMLRVSRSSVYYEATAPDDDELAVMRRIDELHLECPFYGSRSSRSRCEPMAAPSTANGCSD